MDDAMVMEQVCVSLVHPRLGMRSEQWHACHELVLVERGPYQVEMEGEACVLDAGQAAFYPAGYDHRAVVHRDLRSRMWVLQWSGWTPGWDAPFVIEDPGRRILSTLNWMRDRIGAPLADQLLPRLCAVLLLEIETFRHSRPMEDQGIALVRQMLDDGLQHPWTLTEIARHARLSRAYLCRVFSHTYGEPPLAYLARRRIEQAEVLYRDGGRSLAEIAPLVGYATADTLRRAMRRLGRRSEPLRNSTIRETGRA